MTYLPLIGFLSIEALLPDLGAPLVTGVEILLGLDPPLLPGIPDVLRAVNPICSSRYLRMEEASSGLMDCLGIGKLRSDFSLIWKWINMVCMCVLHVNDVSMFHAIFHDALLLQFIIMHLMQTIEMLFLF